MHNGSKRTRAIELRNDYGVVPLAPVDAEKIGAPGLDEPRTLR
jgi:hypothetical protein